jgi:dihydrofolate synthase / folylpolyglutamate synthase
LNSPDPQLRLSALFSRTTKGIRFDLERIRRLLVVSGSPHLQAPAVLIAGTNGKGSLTAMWSRALAAQGLRVGRYTSPHLVRFNERIVVGEDEISDAALARMFVALDHAEVATGIALTFFEAATFMAFVHFAAENVDAMVLEVGMGGRLDATNVCDPLLSLVTSIGLDHTEFLGPTVEAIAREKAGIARRGRPLVVGRVEAAVLQAIRHEAREADLWVVGDRPSHYPASAPAMWGPHQRENAALFALSAEAARGSVLSLSEAAYRAGLEARVSGRYEVRRCGHTRIVIDGAHNEDAVRALVASLHADPEFRARDRTLIFGGTEGRAPETTLAVLAPLFHRVVLCRPNTERALSFEAMQQVTPHALRAASMSEAFALCGEDACVTGSLYLVGDALALLDGQPRDTLSDFR